MEALITKTLIKIRKTSRRGEKDLRASCDNVLKALQDAQEAGVAERRPGAGSADRYFIPFKLACASKSTKVQGLALDCLEKLIAHGYLRGAVPIMGTVLANKDLGPDGGGGPSPGSDARGCSKDDASSLPRTLMDVVVETICECKDASSSDNVQLQVIKALLTAVSSSTCEVHSRSLVIAVHACYHIFLITRNEVNRTTAKACLTQMLHVVFQRMELEHDVPVPVDSATKRREFITPKKRRAVGKGAGEYPIESRHEAGSRSRAGEHGAMYESVAKMLGFSVLLSVVGPAGCSSHVCDDDTAPDEELDDATLLSKLQFRSVLHQDAFLIFRALCTLARKSHNSADGGAVDAWGIKSKILSLELLFSVLDQSGRAFRSTRIFIAQIRTQLCRALLQNCMSQQHDVVGLSLRIFMVLVNRFKDHLVDQVEVFITRIFLRIIESSNSTFEHKILVLDVFYRICQDANVVVELFLNYDAVGMDFAVATTVTPSGSNDLDGPVSQMPSASPDMAAATAVGNSGTGASALPEMRGLFERIVCALERVAQGVCSSTLGSMSGALLSSKEKSRAIAAQDLRLRKVALASLVGILDSLVKFTDEGERERERLGSGSLGRLGFRPGSVYSDGGLAARGTTCAEHTTAARKDFESTVIPVADDTVATSSTPTTALISASAMDAKKQLQRELETAFAKFKAKPKAGINYLIERGRLERDPVQVAAFLRRYPDELDKTQCGDYLGNEKPFCVQVLYAYIDSMDFAGMDFDGAIRFFLSGFRLPGEAQKIDRIMEKFAERFFQCNKGRDSVPGRWESADTPFVLGYSIIMLNTDLHNPNIKPEKKMSLPQFLNQCRGIDGGKDIDRAYLEGIYSRIRENAISLKEDDDARSREAARRKPQQGLFFDESRHRAQMFSKERDDILGGAEAMLTQFQGMVSVAGGNGRGSARRVRRKFRSAAGRGSEHVRPMFEVAWEPMLAVFSVMLATSDNVSIVDLCLRGLRQSVHVSAVEGMDTALMTFVACLVKFTGLAEPFAPKTKKHVECIKALVAVALADGDHLGAVWVDVLAAISQVHRLQLAASGVKDAAGGLGSPGPSRGRKNNGATTSGGGFMSMVPGIGSFNQPSAEEQRRAREDEARAVAQFVMSSIDFRSIDRIFVMSPNLSASAVFHLVSALCRVSQRELDNSRNLSGYARTRRGHEVHGETEGPDTPSGEATREPRVFALQKVVEVADFNIGSRGRITWSKIWSEVGPFFTAVGCHKRQPIALYAIDSLKQLSMKFLEKEELEGFQFQKDFLRPFEVIAARSQSRAVRELVLCVVQNIVLARVQNVRSGWRAIFSVLSAAGGAPLTDPESVSTIGGVSVPVADIHLARSGLTAASVELVQLGFSVLDRIMREHFASAAQHDFLGLCTCLLRYSSCVSVKHSLAALALLRRCASLLADGHVPIRGATEAESAFLLRAAAVTRIDQQRSSSVTDTKGPGSPALTFDNVPRHTELWWPVLTGLAKLVAEPRIEVRMSAVDALFSALRECGASFTPELWRVIFGQILFRIFDDVDLVSREHQHHHHQQQQQHQHPSPPPHPHHHHQQQQKHLIDSAVVQSAAVQGWTRTTCMAALGALVDLFALFYDELRFLLSDILLLLRKCIDQEIQDLACIGVACLKRLLVLAGPHFDAETWDEACASVSTLFSVCMPSALIEARAAMEVSVATSNRHRAPPPPPPRRPRPSAECVATSHGVGVVVEKRERDGIARVRLPWGEVYMPVKELLPAARPERAGLEHSATKPKEGLNARRLEWMRSRLSDGLLPFNEQRVFTQCKVQLELLPALGDVIKAGFPRLLCRHFDVLLDCMTSSYRVAADFNADKRYRSALAQAGFMRHLNLSKLPNLLRQETAALVQVLRVLFRLYSEAPPSGDSAGLRGAWLERQALASRRITDVCSSAVKRYVELDGAVAVAGAGGSPSQVEEGRMVLAFTPILVQILTGFLRVRERQFASHVGWLYPLLVELVQCGSRDLRCVLREILALRVRPLLEQATLEKR